MDKKQHLNCHAELVSASPSTESANLNQYCVYIMTNKYNNVFYVGVTGDLIKRVYEHKEKLIEGFTKKYNTHKLAYYEIHDYIEEAIKREKQIKNWHKGWKENLIKSKNPDFADLYETFFKGDAETSSA